MMTLAMNDEFSSLSYVYCGGLLYYVVIHRSCLLLSVAFPPAAHDDWPRGEMHDDKSQQ